MSNVKINVNFDKTVGKIKQMHSIGQPPFLTKVLGLNFEPMQYITDANIKYSRLHDVAFPFGSNRFVDIPNIFRNFDADETDPANYDFAFTDLLITAMIEHNIDPIYRLGVTIENQSNIRAYHIYPPKDFKKWARICEHIIRHYNEGWADGFYYNIKYWEIWNEPDNQEKPGISMTWLGTHEEYFRLYDITASHLKECFGDKIKVGGYAATDFTGLNFHPERYNVNVPKREVIPESDFYYRSMNVMDFFYGFFDYIKAHNTPLDFFSWHCYGNLNKITDWDDFVARTLKEYGYTNTETMLNEWNWPHRFDEIGNSYASAATAAIMCAMQNKTVDIMCFYDSRIGAVSSYNGLFDVKTKKPTALYYSLKAFGELYALGNQCEVEIQDGGIYDDNYVGDDGGDGVYSVAASNGENKAIMVVNYNNDENRFELNLQDGFKVYMIDEDNMLEETDLNASDFILKPNQTVLIKNY